MLDLHNYPEPKMYLYDAKRVNVLGEYGGIGLPVEGHLWSADKNWGYIEFKTREDVTDRYVTYAEKLMELVERGFSAAVYTQTTDVEGEVNGLVTYYREVVKVDVDRLHEVNRRRFSCPFAIVSRVRFLIVSMSQDDTAVSPPRAAACNSPERLVPFPPPAANRRGARGG